MASRDRTVLYVQYRNSFAKPTSQQQSHIGGGGNLRAHASILKSDDEESLLRSSNTGGRDSAQGGAVAIEMTALPPQWMDIVDQVEDDLRQLKDALTKLEALQKKSILTSFDDTDDVVDRATAEITRMFTQTQNQIKRIGIQSSRQGEDPVQVQLGKNAQSGLASKLSELSNRFRQIQNSYLQKIRGRDGKANDFLIKSGLDAVLNPSSQGGGGGGFNGMNDMQFIPQFNQQQMELINRQSDAISQREKQIEDIAKSIMQLAEIFRDMQTLVIDQGTILDRIDYNIEQVKTNIEPAFQELQKAEQYQKSGKVKYCIIFLILLIVILLIVVMFKPKKR
ncbi:hypothetical protein MP228_005193 [Amoeboaphelidium protococcarum]|nr:hypothetical protein MP228_005193 [Amoeboaphelidium protococcarum]